MIQHTSILFENLSKESSEAVKSFFGSINTESICKNEFGLIVHIYHNSWSRYVLEDYQIRALNKRTGLSFSKEMFINEKYCK